MLWHYVFYCGVAGKILRLPHLAHDIVEKVSIFGEGDSVTRFVMRIPGEISKL
jgi:hypothetical protein